MAAIGIDLGTSNSCIGIFSQNKVDIIPNDKGNNITPTYLAFTDEEILFGDDAKDQSMMNPENAIFDFLKFLGYKFNDQHIEEYIKSFPFKIIRGKQNQILFEVKYHRKIKRFIVEDLITIFFTKMIEMAEKKVGYKINDAVISIPSYFNMIQRQLVEISAKNAGLKVLRIINAVSNAAISFGLNKKSDDERHVIIFDLGGSTLTVSVFDIYMGACFENKAIKWSTNIGGEYFDRRMINYFADRFQLKYKCNMRQSPKALSILRSKCEEAKKALSRETNASIICNSLYEGYDFCDNISRAMFENLNDDLFKSAMELVAQVLKDANLRAEEVTDIVLVGGSSRIPRVQQILQDFFKGKLPYIVDNPNEAAAYGAAIQAAIIKNCESVELKDILLLDAVPLSLGIETHGEIMAVIFPHNNTFPGKKSLTFTTIHDNQSTVTIKVFEGQEKRAKDNIFLGSFELAGIKPAKRNVPQIEVTFEVNGNGKLIVHALDKATENAESLEIDPEKIDFPYSHNKETAIKKYHDDSKKKKKQLIDSDTESEEEDVNNTDKESNDNNNDKNDNNDSDNNDDNEGDDDKS